MGKHKMKQAYEREMALIPIVMEMEKTGICLSPGIEKTTKIWEKKFYDGDQYITQVLGDGCTIGGKNMFNRLNELGLIDEDKIEYTDKGNPRYGREFLPKIVKDEKLVEVLEIRSKMVKMIGTYLRPWADAYRDYGRFFPYFNTTRNEEDRGTRTGRFSSNIQQIPKEPDEELMNLRTMIVPDPHEILIVRDFSAQEVRVGAEYAEGALLDAYREDPDIDIHTFVQGLISDATGDPIERRVSKTIQFLKMYGGGATAAAAQIGVDYDTARAFFAAYDKAIPEFKQLAKDLEQQVRSGVLLRTWGGRQYDVEPAKFENGQHREFYYKLINVLIQGSSADMTKEAMLRYYHHKGRKGRLMLQVHDELVVSVKEKYVDEEMKLLRWAMNEIPGWDVPIRSSGDVGENYGELKAWEEG
mgnify:CR=1 FL=1|tara:strand:- start:1458 stop:2699 length:1242 start_codon:yes stop_codon:yes gene_type:complete